MRIVVQYALQCATNLSEVILCHKKKIIFVCVLISTTKQISHDFLGKSFSGTEK